MKQTKTNGVYYINKGQYLYKKRLICHRISTHHIKSGDPNVIYLEITVNIPVFTELKFTTLKSKLKCIGKKQTQDNFNMKAKL